MLDAQIGKPVRVLLLVVLALVPTVLVTRQFDPQHGFTKLIDFGWEFSSRMLPQVRALSPALPSEHGSDTQFYAQTAIDPSLRDPNIATASDNPEYRARRIFLPFLAWCIGFGRPAAVLTAYALLNLLFWYLLLALLVHLLKPSILREWLGIAAIVWTTGALVSVRYSFTDLPAATLLVLAAAVPLRFKSAVMSAAALTKETYVICIWPVVAEARRAKWRWWQTLGQLGVMLGPLILWMIYLHLRFHRAAQEFDDYSWPMHGWWYAIIDKLRIHEFAEAGAAASLLVQLLYLVTHRRVESFFWRVGITFGIAAVFLSRQPFVEPKSFARDLIVLTIAFNVQLLKESKFWLPWFALGNAGLFHQLWRLIKEVCR